MAEANYEVVTQRETTDFTDDGRFVNVMEVRARTLPLKRPFVERFEVADYTPEAVRARLTERAQTILAVEGTTTSE